jgi:hypothetical protein
MLLHKFLCVCLMPHHPHIAKTSNYEASPLTLALPSNADHGLIILTVFRLQTTTVGRTPLDERLARHRDLYLTTHNTHNRQTSLPLVGFEPTIQQGERPQTHALDRVATGTGMKLLSVKFSPFFCHVLSLHIFKIAYS